MSRRWVGVQLPGWNPCEVITSRGHAEIQAHIRLLERLEATPEDWYAAHSALIRRIENNEAPRDEWDYMRQVVWGRLATREEENPRRVDWGPVDALGIDLKTG